MPADGQTMGEIMFRGNIVMKGYLKDPAATAKAFEGGWFHTGDLAVLEGDRYARIMDPFGHSWSFAHALPAKG